MRYANEGLSGTQVGSGDQEFEFQGFDKLPRPRTDMSLSLLSASITKRAFPSQYAAIGTF